MSSAKKAQLLGMPHGTAQHRLRKAVLFNILQETGNDNCFRCERVIITVDDLSMEHKQAWQGAPDPKVTFFDVKNIAFSHLSCNVGARREDTHCANGHEYTEENTRIYRNEARMCRQCRREEQRDSRNGSGSLYNTNRRKARA
ncbi:hypothetical protein LCGC14_2189450 [marine sediment metagenome]|uniref:HNH domain-containing protein n=1 Tax=marine sediment metagenome TaxID=412755 RepID=A0A0F9E6Y0_9ZZZZ